MVKKVRPPRTVGLVRHGHSKSVNHPSSLTYKAWLNMKQRCLCKTHNTYRFYGSRGVTICDRWMTFDSFLEDMGERQPGESLDRINNTGNYEPSNCRWGTSKQQARNRRSNRFLTYDGKTLTIQEWTEVMGLGNGNIYYRLRLGWSLKDTLTLPRSPLSRKFRKGLPA